MKVNQYIQITRDIDKLSNKQKTKIYQKFFKTGKGQYAEGDKFIGLTVPQQRQLAKKYHDLPLYQIKKLLKSKIHEYRLTALLILVDQFQNSNDLEKKKIVDYYLKHTRFINNWDLVDLSADKILGSFLLNRNKSTFYKLARSKDLWERRIAIVATFAFIKNSQFAETIKIAEILLSDTHDLIHKAVGWMLREIGKRDEKVLEAFLQKHYKVMPRTMLRYAIERFPEGKRLKYLKRT